MTITIELTFEEEALLRQKAERQNQAPENIVHGLVHQGLLALPEQPQLQTVSDEAHEALVQSLLDDGLMTARPSHPGRLRPFRPITMTGKPVSETIIEDRR